MAAAHTQIALPIDVWTSVLAANATKSVTVANIGTVPIKFRCDAGAVVGDSLQTAGFLIINPGNSFTCGVVSGDDLFAAPVGAFAGLCSLLVI